MPATSEPATSEKDALAALIELCGELFATEDISARDNFFVLGGTSLTAVELTVQLASYGFDLPIEAVFTEDTLADLALCCTRTQSPE